MLQFGLELSSSDIVNISGPNSPYLLYLSSEFIEICSSELLLEPYKCCSSSLSDLKSNELDSLLFFACSVSPDWSTFAAFGYTSNEFLLFGCLSESKSGEPLLCIRSPFASPFLAIEFRAAVIALVFI